GLARQTAKSVTDPDEFYEAFMGRLMALAEAHNVLSSGNWEECRLPELPQAALSPFQQLEAIALAGPTCAIPPASCVPLVLALHELGTNALKYGALSVSSGRVSLTWAVAAGSVVLRWEETGGPPVVKPTRRGLGSRLLTKQSGLDAVSLDYRPVGVVCETRINGARLM
ncbi:sensor histidine kinase, partial [Caulobacter sp. HMWF009]